MKENTIQMIYLSGKFITKDNALISPFDRGLLYGDGFFETTRIESARAMFLDRHLARLEKACHLTGWSPLPNIQELKEAVKSLIQMNKVDTGYLRISLTRGPHNGLLTDLRAETPTVLIEAKAMELTPLSSPSPFTIIKSKYTINENAPNVAFKTLSYQGNMLALAEGRQKGADEVFFLNSAGFLTEGAISNLFWVKKGELYTPDVECGLLPGITRDIIIEIGSGITNVHKGYFPEQALRNADAAFCTNSLRGIVPVIKILHNISDTVFNSQNHDLIKSIISEYAAGL